MTLLDTAYPYLARGRDIGTKIQFTVVFTPANAGQGGVSG